MPLIETGIPGLMVFEPKVWEDDRGYFFESYNQRLFEESGIHINFVQDNISKSVKNVLRGLHYQLNPNAQTKLVRVSQGEVLDVAVDIRKGSPTYGQHYKILLSAENKKQLLIPQGFAHGFLVTSDEAEFCYKCDAFYSKADEAGIIWNCDEINIDWGVEDESELIFSDKDLELPSLSEAKNNFEFIG